MRLVRVVPEEPNQRHYSLVYDSSQWRLALINSRSPNVAWCRPCLAADMGATRNGIPGRVAIRRIDLKQPWPDNQSCFSFFIQLCSTNASHSVYAALGLRVLAHLAVGEEGVSHDLTCLSSGGVSSWPEVRQVVRSAWLPYSSAWAAIHHSKVCQAPDVVVEGRAW
jgi:hypothetical protein